jgi:hypothetical protein
MGPTGPVGPTGPAGHFAFTDANLDQLVDQLFTRLLRRPRSALHLLRSALDRTGPKGVEDDDK